ncbi:Hypothetical protein AA314_00270 [Archangium gephyra]|uniref:Uncharacterized protein n=1 Tax=Archangium gephyra TaxID=48 RepID=A0AAC8Q1M3_9BACT|nr:Hypothetical protein AA314_00270 [Archangium gephyra]
MGSPGPSGRQRLPDRLLIGAARQNPCRTPTVASMNPGAAREMVGFSTLGRRRGALRPKPRLSREASYTGRR